MMRRTSPPFLLLQYKVFLVIFMMALGTFPVAASQGEFRVTDHAAGGMQDEPSQFYWSGFMFTVSRETRVTDLVGSASEPGGRVALFEAEVDSSRRSESGDSDAVVLTELLGSGELRRGGLEEVVTLAEPALMEPGRRYVLLQTARSEGTSGKHINVNGLQFSELLASGSRVDSWEPTSDEAIRWDGDAGDWSARELVTQEQIHKNYASDRMPAVGFFYETPVEPANVVTGSADVRSVDSAALHGELLESGLPDDEQYTTALMVEVATADVPAAEAEWQWRLEADPGAVQGGGVGIEPFTAVFDRLEPEQRYYYRAVAQNERGRAEGETRVLDMEAELAVPPVRLTSVGWIREGGELGISVNARMAEEAVIEPEAAGFEYTLRGGDFSDSVFVPGEGNGEQFSAELVELEPGRAYKIRAVVELGSAREVSSTRQVILR